MTISAKSLFCLSDTLGVSALVDSINNMREGIGTENTVLGPFYDNRRTGISYGRQHRPEVN